MDPTPYAWAEIITSSVVPVVIISACGLLCLAFYNRLSVVVTRLRSLQRERLSEYKELLKDEKKGGLLKEESEQFLHFLEDQTVDVLKRAYYLRNCIFCLISCICSLVVTSLVIGLSVVFPILEIFALVFFITGLFLLLYGLSFAIREIKIALNPIQMESGFVQRLIKSQLEKSISK
ncbi:MAG: hypothetical protein K1000chlam2_01334 [Chlamydiae bacterium]|nr:hypothetical protein [Chlamydiota bacterium]